MSNTSDQLVISFHWYAFPVHHEWKFGPLQSSLPPEAVHASFAVIDGILFTEQVVNELTLNPYLICVLDHPGTNYCRLDFLGSILNWSLGYRLFIRECHCDQ